MEHMTVKLPGRGEVCLKITATHLGASWLPVEVEKNSKTSNQRLDEVYDGKKH